MADVLIATTCLNMTMQGWHRLDVIPDKTAHHAGKDFTQLQQAASILYADVLRVEPGNQAGCSAASRRGGR